MQNDKYTKKGLIKRIILFLVWLVFLVFIVDGLGFFSVLEERLGYAVIETLLLLLVIIPAISILLYIKSYLRYKNQKYE